MPIKLTQKEVLERFKKVHVRLFKGDYGVCSSIIRRIWT